MAAHRADSRPTPDQVGRYAQQMMVPSFRGSGQVKLGSTSFLLVGAGGLGSAVALYLAGAGVGSIGIVDDDLVEKGNLHRQVIHAEAFIGKPKVESAKDAIGRINSSIVCRTYQERLTAENAVRLVKMHDVVIDASDNLPTRYLVSDACVIAGKPLVSGAAVSTDGQVTVYNYQGGPCYRCIFPKPPTASAARCSDAGVVGMVPGMVGCMQAMEAVKVAIGMGTPLSRRLCVIDALDGRMQQIKLPGRRPGCVVCGDQPTITEASLAPELYHSAAPPCAQQRAGLDSSGAKSSDSIGGEQCDEASIEVSCVAYRTKTRATLEGRPAPPTPHVLLDVRSELQFGICALPGALNIPLAGLEGRLDELRSAIKHASSAQGGPVVPDVETSSLAAVASAAEEDGCGDGEETKREDQKKNSDAPELAVSEPHQSPGTEVECDDAVPVYVVCRRGIDSLTACQMLRGRGFDRAFNITGGLRAWGKAIDMAYYY